MKNKTIHVTQNDIDNGERKSWCECPIARAVRRAFRAPSHRKVVVRHEAIFVGELDDETMWFADTSPAIERFIKRFDKGCTVKPTTLTLEFR